MQKLRNNAQLGIHFWDALELSMIKQSVYLKI